MPAGAATRVTFPTRRAEREPDREWLFKTHNSGFISAELNQLKQNRLKQQMVFISAENAH